MDRNVLEELSEKPRTDLTRPVLEVIEALLNISFTSANVIRILEVLSCLEVENLSQAQIETLSTFFENKTFNRYELVIESKECWKLFDYLKVLKLKCQDKKIFDSFKQIKDIVQ
jgi:predicted DNA-binding protein (UPF0278 family)